jgi:hypothetical protein
VTPALSESDVAAMIAIAQNLKHDLWLPMTTSVTLILTVIALTFLGCNAQRLSEPAQKGNTHENASSISFEQVCKIAKAEAERRRERKVDVRSCEFKENHWEVFLLDRDSEAFGNHCLIEISTNGLVLAFHGGR